MATLTITDFRYGMDRRRKRTAGVAGTLWLGKNCHISRGGDIERAKRFADTYSLEDLNTHGLAALGTQLYTFGSVARPDDLDSAIGYQRLESPNASVMAAVLDSKPVDGKLYVIARYVDGNIYHFYDGSRVADWDTVAASGGGFNLIATELARLIDENPNVSATSAGEAITITGNDNDTAFTCTASTSNNGVISDETATAVLTQANSPATERSRGYITIQVTGGSYSPGVNRITNVGFFALFIPTIPYGAALNVNWQGSNAATAAALAAAINTNLSLIGTATAVGDTVTVQLSINAPAEDAFVNFVATGAGNVTTVVSDEIGAVAANPGQPQISTVTLGGTFEATDRFIVTIDGTEYSVAGNALLTGDTVFANRKRVWSTANSLNRYSKIATPTDWTDANVASGAGFINVASDSGGADRLVGQARFGQQTAVFSSQNIFFYNIGTDAEEFTIADTLENTGSRSGRAILSYGNIDVFYLDSSGIRSLQARSGTDTAISDDVGSMIDPFVLEYMATLSEATISRSIFIMEPRDGRLWCIIGGRIFVHSRFRQSKISAWTYYEPGFVCVDAARIGQRLYLRGDDDHVYVYGGLTGDEYPEDDELPVTVSLPFLTGQEPATTKQMTGWDIACTNRWTATVLVDPTDETKVLQAGTVAETNYHKPAATYPGLSTHMGLDLTCSKGGEASISMISLHYDKVEAR